MTKAANGPYKRRHKVNLAVHCQQLIAKAGSIRKAANRHDVDPSYLYRLSQGEKFNPSPEVLKKLGLVECRVTTVDYYRSDR